MNAKDAIRSSANLSTTVLKTYISDLDDADLMRRPGVGCNHLAWQLGHLISSEVQLLDRVAPGQGIELPVGFADAHSKEACNNDDPVGFHRKRTYVELFDKLRAVYHRRAVRRVLVDHDYLSITRRSIPQPIHLAKCARII
jgi:hypothetical protein